MNWNKRDYAEDAKISILERTSYALGNMGNCIGLTVIAYFMLFFYNDILGSCELKVFNKKNSPFVWIYGIL